MGTVFVFPTALVTVMSVMVASPNTPGQLPPRGQNTLGYRDHANVLVEKFVELRACLSKIIDATRLIY